MQNKVMFLVKPLCRYVTQIDNATTEVTSEGYAQN